MFREINTTKIESHARSAEIGRIMRLYEAAKAAPDQLASFRTFNLTALEEFREHLMLLMPTGGGDYTYLHYGPGIARIAGFDLSGQCTSTLGGEVAAFFSECYAQALGERRLVHTFHQALRAGSLTMWERLICPVDAGLTHPLLMVFNKPVAHRNDLLATVMEASPNGILAYKAIRNAQNLIEDAVLVTMNPAAARLMDVKAEQIIGRPLLQTAPQIARTGIWDIYRRVIETGHTAAFETQLAPRRNAPWLRASVSRWSDGFVVVFADITELKHSLSMIEQNAALLRLEVGAERAANRALTDELTQTSQRAQVLEMQAENDPLTGLPNRRGFRTRLTDLIKRRARDQAVLVMTLDIDHFKQVNDTYGHAAGDAVLVTFAARLINAIDRQSSFVARFGGEEFVMCALVRTHINPDRLADDLRQSICSVPFDAGGGLRLTITCSAGFTFHRLDEGIDAALKRADGALYAAKRDGRNCTRSMEVA